MVNHYGRCINADGMGDNEFRVDVYTNGKKVICIKEPVRSKSTQEQSTAPLMAERTDSPFSCSHEQKLDSPSDKAEESEQSVQSLKC